MRKVGHIFAILISYFIGLALFIVLVYGSIPQGNPDFLSAKKAFLSAREQLMKRHGGCDFYVWEIKAGSTDIYNNASIKFGKSDKWRVTFIKHDKKKDNLEMVVATLERGKLSGEGIFDVGLSEKKDKLIAKLKKNNAKIARWNLDSSTIYYKNLFLAKERKYRKLSAIHIDLTNPKTEVNLSFVRKMTDIESKGFAFENHFVLNMSLSLNNKILEIKEMPVEI